MVLPRASWVRRVCSRASSAACSSGSSSIGSVYHDHSGMWGHSGSLYILCQLGSLNYGGPTAYISVIAVIGGRCYHYAHSLSAGGYQTQDSQISLTSSG